MSFPAKVRMERAVRGGDYTDHTDEPYIWRECPWCGGDLPMPNTDDSEDSD